MEALEKLQGKDAEVGLKAFPKDLAASEASWFVKEELKERHGKAQKAFLDEAKVRDAKDIKEVSYPALLLFLLPTRLLTGPAFPDPRRHYQVLPGRAQQPGLHRLVHYRR